MRQYKYSEFVNRISLDQLYNEIGFEVIDSKGDEDHGHCFDIWNLHKNGDTTGKLYINREKKVYNCWVCGGGSLLSLVRDLYNYDLEAAVDYLAKFVDGEATDDQFMDEFERLLTPLTSEPELIPYYNPRVLDEWSDPNDWTGILNNFLIQKNILHYGTLDDYRVGFNKYAKKYPPRNKQTGELLGDIFIGPAVVFPHFWQSRLVGWQYRWLVDDRPKWCAKYSNTPDFPKMETLYGYDMVKRRSHPIVVTESVTTVLKLARLNIPAVATFGASVTDKQKKLLRTFQQGVIIAPDNDKPGIKMLLDLVDYLEGFIPISYIEPAGNPGDNIGDHHLDRYIENTIHEAERIY